MKYLSLFLLLPTILDANPVDVAGGNHQTYTLKNGIVLSMGQDLHIPTEGGKDWIGGKLGRLIDKNVLPGKSPNSLAAQANYNPTPAPVLGLEGLNIVNIACGQNDAAAITGQGELYMWGPNNHGQLGLGDTQQRRTATKVPLADGIKIKDIAIGGAHTLALTTEGKVYSWGFGKTGILGHGDIVSISSPKLIEAFTDKTIIAIATGQNTHSMFLDEDGIIYSCGLNSHGLLGLPVALKEIVSTPTKINSHVKFKAIAVGIQTGFGISNEGRLYGWGNGSMAHFARNLPDGTPDLSNLMEPRLLENTPTNLTQVVAGSRHTAVLDAQGNIFTWGKHTILSGQLGIGPPELKPASGSSGTIHTTPQKVILPDGQKAQFLDSLTNNIFLTTTEGNIYGWGQTAHGRMGCPVDAIHKFSYKGKTLYLAHSPVPVPYK